MIPDAHLLRNPSVALAPTEDGYLAFDIQSSQLHRLNAAAALSIELCDGTQNADTIIAQVSTFIPGEGAEAGCRAWIGAALRSGLLTAIAPGDAIPEAPPLDAF